MKAVLFGGGHSSPSWAAMVSGLEMIGYKVDQHILDVYRRGECDKRADIAVFAGLSGFARIAVETYEKAGKKTILVDLPHIRIPRYHRVTPTALQFLSEKGSGRFEKMRISLPEKANS